MSFPTIGAGSFDAAAALIAVAAGVALIRYHFNMIAVLAAAAVAGAAWRFAGLG